MTFSNISGFRCTLTRETQDGNPRRRSARYTRRSTLYRRASKSTRIFRILKSYHMEENCETLKYSLTKRYELAVSEDPSDAICWVSFSQAALHCLENEKLSKQILRKCLRMNEADRDIYGLVFQVLAIIAIKEGRELRGRKLAEVAAKNRAKSAPVLSWAQFCNKSK